MHGCRRHLITPDQFMLHVHRYMVLAVIIRLAVLLRPTGTTSLHRCLCSGHSGNPSLLDQGILLSTIALFGRAGKAGIHNLPFHHHKPLGLKVGVKQQKTVNFRETLNLHKAGHKGEEKKNYKQKGSSQQTIQSLENPNSCRKKKRMNGLEILFYSMISFIMIE